MQLRDVTTKSVKPEHAMRVDRTQTNDSIFAGFFASARAESSQRDATQTAQSNRRDRIESIHQEQHHKSHKEDAQPDRLSDQPERTRPTDEASRETDHADRAREHQDHDKTSEPAAESSPETTNNEIDRPADQNSYPSDNQDNESGDASDQNDSTENSKDNSFLAALAAGTTVTTNTSTDTNPNAANATTETLPLQADADPTAQASTIKTSEQPQETQNKNLAFLLNTPSTKDADTQAPKAQSPQSQPVLTQQTTSAQTQAQNINAADNAASEKNEAAAFVASSVTNRYAVTEVSVLPAGPDTKTQPQAPTQSTDSNHTTNSQPAPQPITTAMPESTDSDARQQSGLGQQRHQDTPQTSDAQTSTQSDATVVNQVSTTGEQKSTAHTSQSQNLDSALAANSKLGQTNAIQPETRSNPAAATTVTAQADGDRLHARQNTEEVVKAVRAAYSRGQSRIQMRLDPPELGTLRVEIRQNSNGLTIQLQATSSKAHELLQQTRQDLQAALEASGISPRGIDVQLRLDLRNDPNTQHHNNQPQDFNQNNPNPGQQQGRANDHHHSDPNPGPHTWQQQSNADSPAAQQTQTVNPGWQQLSFAGLDLTA